MRNHPYRSPYGAAPAVPPVPHLPHPQGWFCVGFSQDFKPGTVAPVPFMDGEVVIYRTRSGRLRVTRPYCPHLGAHLGAGGKVEGELLVCPFHHFGFAVDGTCAKTPYGKPPRARLSLVHSRELYGIVWVWHSERDEEPSWDLPVLPVGDTYLARHGVDLCGHPQDQMENAIDYGHVPELHKVGIQVLEEPKVNGCTYVMSYRLQRPLPLIGCVDTQIKVTLIGMGCMHVKFTFGRHSTADAWLMPTPTGPWRMRLWYAAAIDYDSLPAPLRRLPRRPAEWVGASLLNKWSVRDGSVDCLVFHHKTYLHHPKLNDSDGPIGAFRKWAEQFYPRPDTLAARGG